MAMRRLAVANGPNIFRMLLVVYVTLVSRSAHFPKGLYILPALIYFFYSFLMIARRTIIAGSTGPIFAIFFYRTKMLWMQMIDLDLCFRYLKGRCHGNQFCDDKRCRALPRISSIDLAVWWKAQ